MRTLFTTKRINPNIGMYFVTNLITFDLINQTIDNVVEINNLLSTRICVMESDFTALILARKALNAYGPHDFALLTEYTPNFGDLIIYFESNSSDFFSNQDCNKDILVLASTVHRTY
jgi:hypothetical protein